MLYVAWSKMWNWPHPPGSIGANLDGFHIFVLEISGFLFRMYLIGIRVDNKVICLLFDAGLERY